MLRKSIYLIIIISFISFLSCSDIKNQPTENQFENNEIPEGWPSIDSIILDSQDYQFSGIDHNDCVDYILSELINDNIDPYTLSLSSITYANYVSDYLNNNSDYYIDVMDSHDETSITPSEIQQQLIILDSILTDDLFLDSYTTNQTNIYNTINQAIYNNSNYSETISALNSIDSLIQNNLTKNEQIVMYCINSVAKKSAEYWYSSVNRNAWLDYINYHRDINNEPPHQPTGIQEAVDADVKAFAGAMASQMTTQLAVNIAYEVGIAMIQTFGNVAAAITIGVARAAGKQLARAAGVAAVASIWEY